MASPQTSLHVPMEAPNQEHMGKEGLSESRMKQQVSGVALLAVCLPSTGGPGFDSHPCINQM